MTPRCWVEQVARMKSTLQDREQDPAMRELRARECRKAWDHLTDAQMVHSVTKIIETEEFWPSIPKLLAWASDTPPVPGQRALASEEAAEARRVADMPESERDRINREGLELCRLELLKHGIDVRSIGRPMPLPRKAAPPVVVTSQRKAELAAQAQELTAAGLPSQPKGGEMSSFEEFAKIARLSREMVVTEKIDGTNAQVLVVDAMVPGVVSSHGDDMPWLAEAGGMVIAAGSRSRWLTLGHGDNFGFAAWVKAHADELAGLGPGRHFGEWWGQGIQRRYGLDEKRFSLFNVGRWRPADLPLEEKQAHPPACCSVVPVLFRGAFCTEYVEQAMDSLHSAGSSAAPGFMDPEGVVIFHSASGQLFKKTLKGDEKPKSAPSQPRERA